MKIKKFNDKKIKIEELSKKHLKEVKVFQEYINSLIVENAKISMDQKLTLKEEKEWLKGQIKLIEKNKAIYLIAYDKNKMISGSGIILDKGKSSHVGVFGITIKNGYRRIGLGSFLLKELIKLSKKKLKPKPKIIRLSVFASNQPAINLYEKIGFKKIARIPKTIKHNKKLIDEIIMTLEF